MNPSNERIDVPQLVSTAGEEIGAEIIAIYIKEGDFVRENSPLVLLETEDSFLSIRAPRDCYILRVLVAEGNQAFPRQPILIISDIEPPEVPVSEPQDNPNPDASVRVPTAGHRQRIYKNPHSSSDRNKNVFIVHGHDDQARFEVEKLLIILKLNPIVLREEGNKGRTIIEKLDDLSDVSYAICLFTPDDKGLSRKEISENNDTEGDERKYLKCRARQNVVFETGYFAGKIHRHNVCILVKGEIERPSNMHGIAYYDMDPAGAWRLALAREMKQAGIDIDLNDLA